jgi:hypothetical protein
MAWNNVSATAIDIKKQKGVSHEGTYRGKREITTKVGPQVIWDFVGEDGVGFGIYGFTNLNRAMESLSPGVLCKITYNGTQNVQTRFGMKDVHQCQVDVWQDDKEDPLEFLGPKTT